MATLQIEVGKDYAMKMSDRSTIHVRVLRPGSTPEVTKVQIVREDGSLGWAGPVATRRLIRPWSTSSGEG